jgi:hypothetical protein
VPSEDSFFPSVGPRTVGARIIDALDVWRRVMGWMKCLGWLNPWEPSFSPRSDKELKAVTALLVSLVWLLIPSAGLPGFTVVWLTGAAIVAGAFAAYGWLRDDELARDYRPESAMIAQRRSTWKRRS